MNEQSDLQNRDDVVASYEKRIAALEKRNGVLLKKSSEAESARAVSKRLSMDLEKCKAEAAALRSDRDKLSEDIR